MKTLWLFTPWFVYSNESILLAARYNIPNAAELLRARPAHGEFARTELPTAQLEITDEDFDDDCFQMGVFIFVSEKMRRAMALGPSDIQYFDVDTSRSPPLPRSKHYQLLHVAVAEDVSDPEHSDYTYRHRPDGCELYGDPRAVAFRQGADPAHELFYDRFFKVAFCTDAFALRVLWAGCTGARFLDPAHLDHRGGRFRTLRGIEEAGDWDPVRNTYSTKLVREIP